MSATESAGTKTKAQPKSPPRSQDSAIVEFVAFGRSALGLEDPMMRLRALASFGTSLIRVKRGVIATGHRQAPARPLVLFEAEYCPFCRHVREALTELDLDAMIYPVPKRGKRFHARLKKLSGKTKVPFLHDPNTGKMLGESEAIVEYLYKQYGHDWEKVPERKISTSTLASATRGKNGMFASPSVRPKKALELYSWEGSPYARMAREKLCELEIPYMLHNVGKSPGSHADYMPPEYRAEYMHDYTPGTENRRKLLARAGKVQVPYLIDANTGVAMFETRAIREYLQKTYGA